MIRKICFDNSAEYLALPSVVDSTPFAPAGQRPWVRPRPRSLRQANSVAE